MHRFLSLPMLLLIFTVTLADGALIDSEIRQILIQQSIRSYSGSCPCPYNTMSNGRRCGGNSAYSEPGGAEPLCYASDVSDSMVERYRTQQKEKK